MSNKISENRTNVIDTNFLINHWVLTKKKQRNLDWKEESIGKEHLILHSRGTYIVLSKKETQPTLFSYDAGRWKLNKKHYLGFFKTDQNGKKQEASDYSYRFLITELDENHLILRIQSRDGYVYYYYELFTNL